MFVTRVFVRCLVLLAIVASPLAQADAVSEIVERGTLRVGISEFVPWAMPAKRGGHVGHDIDLGVARLLVKDDVAEKKCVLALDHLGPADVFDGGQLGYRDLAAPGGRDENLPQVLDCVPQLAQVADADRVPFPPFHSLRDRLTSNGYLNHILDHLNFDSVSRDCVTVYINLQIRFIL